LRIVPTIKQKTNELPRKRKGYYGEFGGAYIPEMLYQMLKSYIKLFKITAEPSFQAEFDSLLKNM
jgi:tryptophan synthase beta chain